MKELKKPFLKNQLKKRKTENQCQNAACEQKNHLTTNGNLVQTKQNRTRMNYEWIGKTI